MLKIKPANNTDVLVKTGKNTPQSFHILKVPGRLKKFTKYKSTSVITAIIQNLKASVGWTFLLL